MIFRLARLGSPPVTAEMAAVHLFVTRYGLIGVPENELHCLANDFVAR